MRIEIKRRSFLSGVAVAGAGVLAGGCGGRRAAQLVTEPERVVPTYCEVCFWKCGVRARARGERVVALEGNPLSPNNNGRLCARGNAGTGFLEDPDRLRAPLRRIGERGSGRFEEITWAEALTAVVGGLDRIRERHGPESIALFSHGSAGKYFTRLLRALGSPNYVQPSYAQCRGPRDEGYRLTFGAGLGSPEPTDMRNARFLLLLGSHLGENMHLLQAQEFAQAIARGAKIAVADPRFSTAAGKADWWLPIRPGSDTALLLALIHVLLAEGLHDREFVERNTTGLEALRSATATATPEWAAFHTDIPAATIREIAREMGRARPAVLVHPGRHATWYGNDVQRARAMAILTALVGAWGREGGILRPGKIRLAPPPGLPEDPEPRRGPADGMGDRFPFATDGVATGMRDATRSGEPYPIKAWLVSGTNLVKTLPNTQETLQAIERLDLLVAVDILPTEIVGHADIVLPECTYLERWDGLVAPRFRRPYVTVRQPVVTPRWESKSGWEIARELARGLGIGEWFPYPTQAEELRAQADASGLDWATLLRDGVVRAADESGATEAPTFDTPSGKVELYSAQLAALGFDPIPRYEPTAPPPAGFVRLIYGRAPVHSFARTQNNRFLAGLMAENAAWISPRTARAWGVANGQRVTLENQDGARSGPIAVLVTQRIRDDVLYMVNGFGHDALRMRRAHGRGAADSELITRYAVDPLMGGTGMRVNFVRPASGHEAA